MSTDTPGPQLIDVAVLDDDPDFLTYIEDFLKDEGPYAVRVFQRPEALLADAERSRPDLVLLDMKMGEVRGETVLEQLLARHPGLCVIIVTGYPSMEDMRATFQMKAFDYIAKPFTLAQMRDVLARAVARFGLGRALQEKLRERLGPSLRLLRTERDWSLKDLAAHSNLSISQISSIERGANLPSMESLLAIARAFDRKPSEILAVIDF